LSDAAGFLRRLDVFCLPARREALSPALLEALAYGLPCVTTSTGDTMEALTGAAMIVPPDNVDGLTAVLDRVVTDTALRHKLARDARERAVRDFDARRMAARTAEVLAGVTTPRPATPDARFPGRPDTRRPGCGSA